MDDVTYHWNENHTRIVNSYGAQTRMTSEGLLIFNAAGKQVDVLHGWIGENAWKYQCEKARGQGTACPS